MVSTERVNELLLFLLSQWTNACSPLKKRLFMNILSSHKEDFFFRFLIFFVFCFVLFFFHLVFNFDLDGLISKLAPINFFFIV